MKALELLYQYQQADEIAGVWINDDLEAGCKGTRIFLPLHNINQINEYEIEN